MLERIEINSPDELIGLIQEEQIDNLLLGNGFGLSHPILSNAFYFDFNYVKNELGSELESKITFTNDEKKCPEKFLDKLRSGTAETKRANLRLKATQIIISSYINSFSNGSSENDKLWDLYKKTHYSCNGFLGLFKNIYTLNYDPLMYFEFLKLLDTDRLNHKDGFIVKNEGSIGQKCITSNLENSEYRFVYLHGNYFININKKNNELNKLGRNNITKKELRKRLFDTVGDIRPFLILEGRCESKKQCIEKYDYFKYCYESLKKTTGSMLVYGVSFNNDKHILEVLYLNNRLNHIFLTYQNSDDVEKIRNDLPQEIRKKFYFLNLKVKNCIWTNDAIDDALRTGYDNWDAFINDLSEGNLSRYLADIEDGNKEEFPECIENVKNSESFDDLYGDSPNHLYSHLILEQIRGTDVANDLNFDDLKTSILISLSKIQKRIK